MHTLKHTQIIQLDCVKSSTKTGAEIPFEVSQRHTLGPYMSCCSLTCEISWQQQRMQRKTDRRYNDDTNVHNSADSKQVTLTAVHQIKGFIYCPFLFF